MFPVSDMFFFYSEAESNSEEGHSEGSDVSIEAPDVAVDISDDENVEEVWGHDRWRREGKPCRPVEDLSRLVQVR